MISHIDLCIGLVAVLTLVRAARRPHPVHPTTAILLTLLTGVLLWANLRPTGWQEARGRGLPAAVWTQSQELCSSAGGPSPHSWSASFTACDSIPTALKMCPGPRRGPLSGRPLRHEGRLRATSTVASSL